MKVLNQGAHEIWETWNLFLQYPVSKKTSNMQKQTEVISVVNWQIPNFDVHLRRLWPYN